MHVYAAEATFEMSLCVVGVSFPIASTSDLTPTEHLQDELQHRLTFLNLQQSLLML